MTTTKQQYGIQATKAGIDALANIGVALADNRTPIDFLFDIPKIADEILSVAPKFGNIITEASEYSQEELAQLGAYALGKIPAIFIRK